MGRRAFIAALFALLASCGTTGLTGEPDSTQDTHAGSDSAELDTGVDEPEEPAVPDETWVLFTGPDYPRRYGRKFTETRDGGLAFAGYSDEGVVWIVKLDADENIEWSKYASGSSYPQGIAEGPEGNLVIAGPTGSMGSGGQDVWLLELNSSGEARRQRAIGTSGNERAHGIVPLADRGFAVVARTSETDPYSGSAWVARLDPDLDITWLKRFPGLHIGTLDGAISVTRSGDLLVAGSTWIVRLDPDGSLLWHRNITGGTGGDGVGVAEMTDGDIALSVSIGGITVLRFDAGGSLLWQRSYGGSWTYAITHGDLGQILVAGCVFGPDMWILGLDTDGSVLWQKQALIPAEDSAYDMRRTSDGAVVTLSGGCCTTGIVKLVADGTFFGDCDALVETRIAGVPASLSVEEGHVVPEDLAVTVIDSEPTVIDTPAEREMACRGP